MSRDPAILLAALVESYWSDGVTQKEAAKLLGIRKECFAELADLLLIQRGMQRAANRYLMLAFHRQFPHCDPSAWAQTRHATRPAMSSDGD